MKLLIAKYAVTALVIVAASEIAKRTGKLGALIGALPFVAIMVMIWLHVEQQSSAKIARYAGYTFWYVLPTLPMFLVVPALLDRNMTFWPALSIGAVISIVCFALTALVASRFGVNLIP